MCDFADDPENVRDLLVGRVLTLDGLRVFLRAVLAFGMKKQEVKTMLVDNPAKLMWLDAVGSHHASAGITN
jgi:hypothetical protein